MLNKSHTLPQDIMELEDTTFFDFVKKFSGEKITLILESQDINSVQCLLACNDPFEILSYDSDELLDLKKKTCVKLNNNSFVVLPGLKTKMEFLTSALIKKRNDLKKTISRTSSNTSNKIVTTHTSSSDVIGDHFVHSIVFLFNSR